MMREETEAAMIAELVRASAGEGSEGAEAGEGGTLAACRRGSTALTVGAGACAVERNSGDLVMASTADILGCSRGR